MDLEKTLNNLSLYDAKKYFRKAQNVMYNYSEMEGKVREATNNEPWGTSSTLMQQIAAGTYNYREREEIIAMTFRRFTEKAASEWRQIYKALQLLEYLIKNGSERFIDDVRANISLIQMLKSFHYIDSQGKDQGINVRNRVKLLVALLNDDNLIRSERKKARENSKKYRGVSSGAVGGASASYLPPNADFDDEDDSREGTPSYSAPTGGMVFGDGGVFGARFEERREAGMSTRHREDFEEYEVSHSASASTPAPVVQQTQNVDLFSFDEPATPAVAPTPAKSAAAPTPAAAMVEDDDEFDDFQSAAPAQSTAPAQNFGGFVSAPAATMNSSFGMSSNNAPPISANKPADPFGSLFSSARNVPVAPAKKQPAAPAKTSPIDDDFFGELTSAPAKPSAQPSAQQQTAKPSEEIDLLSF